MQEDALETNGEIAVIGMACRFPGARDVDAFWENLKSGVESISRLAEADLETSPTDRSPDRTHPDFVQVASAIEDIDQFDAQFFGYGPKEASLIDPQQRLFLEHAWMALESAGYDPTRYPNAVGVFAGGRMNTYVYNLLANRPAVGNLTPFELAVFNDYACLSTRVAYKLNLRGPAYSVHSACSTGLAAIHLACQSVLLGESHMAIAGAVAVTVPQRTGYLYRDGGILSPDGHCRPFDENARGTVLGSGVGAVVLKRLEDARRDGDTILAVIKGSAANNDGSDKASYTAPSVSGQAAVIEEAVAVAGVDPGSISYVEAHGTGTQLGDPIELRALSKAYGSGANPSARRAIGSVKSNVGHLESAAGLAGFIKTVLALKHRQLPPSLHITRPIAELESFHVNSELTPWEVPGGRRRAGISAFGVGGTNIHMVLEEAPDAALRGVAEPPFLLPVSARTSKALDQANETLAQYLERNADASLADVAHTLQLGRAQFEHRFVALCRDSAHAIEVLHGRDPAHAARGARQVERRLVAFMFAGQGAQHHQMGADLYRRVDAFRETVDRCAALLTPELGIDIRTVLYGEEARPEEIDQTWLAQPLLFVVQYAAARALIAAGVVPSALIGHSIGEYVAACLAEVFSLEDALRVVALRGRLVQALPRGSMLSVLLPEGELSPLLPGHLDLAAINAPDACVVSGAISEVEAFAKRLEARDVKIRRLQTSHAFHSAMLDQVLDEFARRLSEIELGPPRIPFVSNVSGTWIKAEEATDPHYWAQHLRRPVRFAAGLASLSGKADTVWIDVGPTGALSRLAVRQRTAQSPGVVSIFNDPKRERSGLDVWLMGLGKLWVGGVALDWTGLTGGSGARRVPLPTYPFQRQRHWIDALPDGAGATGSPNGASAARYHAADDQPTYYLPSWRRLPALSAGAPVADPRTWLVFVLDGDPLSEQLITCLTEAGHAVVVVVPGRQYCFLSENRYAINPMVWEDFVSLAAELALLERLPERVLHLWALEPTAAQALVGFDAAQALGFHSLLGLARAFSEHVSAQGIELITVASGLHDVSGDDPVRPERATVLGPCRVIPLEYPRIRCRSIDVVVPPDAEGVQGLGQRLLEEIAAGSEPEVSLRGRHRWARTFVLAGARRSDATVLRQDGSYLVINGLSGVGFECAKYLSRGAATKLVVLEAEPLPPVEMWEEWVARSPGDDPVSIRVRHALELRSGSELMVASADFSSRASIASVIAGATARFGALHGVFHAAASQDGHPIAMRGDDAIESTFTVKAKGLLLLREVLRETPLDFFIAFGSAVSSFGGFGRVDAVAADAFLDAAADSVASEGGRFGVINWDVSTEDAAILDAVLAKSSLPIPVADGLRQRFGRAQPVESSFPTALALAVSGATRVFVSSSSPEQRCAEIAQVVDQLRTEGGAGAQAKQSYSRPDLQTEYVAPCNDEERLIAQVWQDVLGVEPIGIHDDFFELGGHSLLVTMIAGRLREALGMDIPMDKLFARPTIAGVIQAKAELQATSGDAAEILDLLAQLTDDDAERELSCRLTDVADEGEERNGGRRHERASPALMIDAAVEVTERSGK